MSNTHTRPRWQRAPESLQPGHKVEIRLSFKIGDPKFAHVEGLYKALAHGQMSRVMLGALEQGAQIVTKELLAQQGQAAQAPRTAPQPSAPPAPRVSATPAAAPSPAPQAQATAASPRPAGAAGRGLSHFQQGQ